MRTLDLHPKRLGREDDITVLTITHPGVQLETPVKASRPFECTEGQSPAIAWLLMPTGKQLIEDDAAIEAYRNSNLNAKWHGSSS